MKGIEALDFFLEDWNSKIQEYDDFCEFNAMIEYSFGSEVKFYETSVSVNKFFDRKLFLSGIEDISEFLPEELEYDPFSRNLYVKRNLFTIKIAPKIC